MKKNKIAKYLYITHDNIKKLDILKNENSLNYSTVINILISKQKKIKLI